VDRDQRSVDESNDDSISESVYPYREFTVFQLFFAAWETGRRCIFPTLRVEDRHAGTGEPDGDRCIFPTVRHGDRPCDEIEPA
jgi:hypothetical protein